MTEATHRTVETNGIRMHLAKQVTGPLVLLCHGFPESWFRSATSCAAWPKPDLTRCRRTCEAMARPTSRRRPTNTRCCTWSATWSGCSMCWAPKRRSSPAMIGVPLWRGSRHCCGPTASAATVMPQTDDTIFYQLYLQAPGVAEADYERDVRLTLGLILYWHSGDAPRRADNARPRHMVPRQGGVFTHASNLPPLPAWLSETDLDFFAAEFGRTGFRGGLNYYRNIDRNWELLAPFAGARVTVPALFLAGERDPVLAHPGMQTAILDQSTLVPQLGGTIMLPGCGHWIQQERPAEVTAAMIDFIRGLT